MSVIQSWNAESFELDIIKVKERNYEAEKSGIEKDRAGTGPSASGNRLETGGPFKTPDHDREYFREEARKGVAQAGGHGARYFTTDICDGEAQGHDGINYSLASRDMIANMIEIHANATPFDGGVFIASCDKGMPAHLMGVGRVNIPSIIVTGGVMDAGPDLLTLEHKSS